MADMIHESGTPERGLQKLYVPDGDVSMPSIRRLLDAQVRTERAATQNEMLQFAALPGETRSWLLGLAELPTEARAAVRLFTEQLSLERPQVMLEAAQFLSVYPGALRYMMTGEWVQKLIHHNRGMLQGIVTEGELLDLTLDSFAPLSAEECLARIRQREVSNKLNKYVRSLADFFEYVSAVIEQGDEPRVVVGQGEVIKLVQKGIHTAKTVLPPSCLPSCHAEFHEPLPSTAIKKMKLLMAVTNVVANGLQAASVGGLVTVHVAPVETEGRKWLRVQVCDSGPGIDESDMRIGTLGYTTKPRGTGFGVYGTKKMLTEIGGRFELRNRRDGRQGAEGTIFIPAAA